MIAEPLLKTGQDLSPNEWQARASNPGQSVWVAASAGSGKTKVLTDRVLRLLLPRPDGTAGTPPDKILCLTFTKAGAAEMADRIARVMSDWATAAEDALHKDLTKLLGHPPSPAEIESARRLFASVIDSPGGLKILTIHSFCQSVLGRFPIEAGLTPGFTVADESITAPMRQAALEAVLSAARTDPSTPLHAAIQNLSSEKNEEDLTALLQCVMSERSRLSFLRYKLGSVEAIAGTVFQMLDVPRDLTPDDLIRNAFEAHMFDEASLRACCREMAARGGSKMQKRVPLIQGILDAEPAQKPGLFADYLSCFLTKGEIRKDLYVKDFAAACPDLVSCLMKEAERLQKITERLKALRCAALTRDLLLTGFSMLEYYGHEKEREGVLDYDDLIVGTLNLLSGRSMNTSAESAAQWVMYKLDQGIDHILLDEAQDTNPEQWEIIQYLCGDFFDGSGARGDIDRTIFAVGDEKQSIFGFQRAAPEKFRRAEADYKSRAFASGKAFESIPFNFSFRSTASVLAVTDAVFDGAEPWKNLGLPDGTIIRHHSQREGQAGRVELWPLIEPPEPKASAPWTMPVVIEDNPNAAAMLSRKIAATIRAWLDNGEILESQNRPVRPGDIMILVKSRKPYMDHLVSALKTARIPVSGVDRMQLSDQIAVQDLLAAAAFALLPEDDLSLACLLKSPLVGIDEEGLYYAAIDRSDKSLWSAVRDRLPENIVTWLSGLIARAGSQHPYEFFSGLLHRACPGDSEGSGLRAMMGRLGEEALDPLQEFLNVTLNYETGNTPSLQHFLTWNAANQTEIKREMDNAGEADGGKVRIMTVHASKGLQAPIVFLPDTVHGAQSMTRIGTGERVLWTAQQGLVLPLWSPRTETDCAVYRDALTERKARMAEEYRRLYYVALTRAADRLYIAGAIKPGGTVHDECWFAMAERAFARLEQSKPSGLVFETIMNEQELDMAAFRLSNPQTAPARIKNKKEKAEIMPACDDWTWMTREPPVEETPPRPFAPSRPSEPEPAMLSPLNNASDPYRFRRGIVTHTLLQFLPELPASQWEQAAQSYVAAQDLSEEVKNSVVSETMSILTHPDYAALFGPGSMAEVPVTALIGQRLVSGQIDRLLVTESEIMIVDYKTNRPPPADLKDIPAAYRTQLRAYRDTIAKIYPGRAIRTFLLWTDGPRMVELSA